MPTHDNNVKNFINPKTNKMSKEQILGIARHALTFIGGILIMKGIIDEGTWTEVSGGVITLAGTVWSIIDKNKK
jgi:hypothetical protein